MKKQLLSSIKKRILFITLSCIACMCLLIGLVSYVIFQRYLQRNTILSTEAGLQLLSDSVNAKMQDIYRIIRYCRSNSAVASYVENDVNASLAVSTHSALSEEYYLNSSHPYLPRIAIIRQDSFLQIVSPTFSSTAKLHTALPKLPFFERLLADPDYNFSAGLIADPFHRKGKQVLPVLRPITSSHSPKQIGYVFAEIAAELFTDSLQRYQTAPDSMIYLVLDNHVYRYENDVLTATKLDFTAISDLSDYAASAETIIKKVVTRDGSRQIIVSRPLNMKNCYLIQSISRMEVRQQVETFWGVLLATLIGILLIGSLLILVMNRMITLPVSMIRSRMAHIAQGDFSRDASIEWPHELGEIGRGINDLSESVALLMERRLEDEKQKRDLEYQMLQSQINPHFIYNTLNSIKWMATIQGADGISEITTALSRLLKSISKGTSLLITLREELLLLENYFTIQKYRYGGTITMKIKVEDESLYDSQIIKFTLQPLVENAIFHGIEPTCESGHIDVQVRREPSGVCIAVTDNGVGIPPEKAELILSGKQENHPDFFQEIGISNVHKRLQYQFGKEFGISIDSCEGEYTTMLVHIPEQK